MIKKTAAILFLFIGLFFALVASAEENIGNYEVAVVVNGDSSISVEETITYDFGPAEKHGIYRDILYRYNARGGNFELGISDIDVTVDGADYSFKISRQGDYRRIMIGDPDKFVTGAITYAISYRVDRAINYFNDHDELYWNAIGNEWQAPIGQAKVTVSLPAGFDTKQVKVECFAGKFGSADNCVSSRYIYENEDLVSGFVFANDRLVPGEGMTVVIGWPKGGVVEPTAIENIIATVEDNFIIGLPFAVLAALIYFWRTHGRDPRGRGTIIAEFDAPDNLTPAEVGVLVDEKAQSRDISATIVDLAVRGFLKISRLKTEGVFKKADYELVKLKTSGELDNDFEKKLFEALFEKTGIVKLSSLKNEFYKDWEKVKKELYSAMVEKGYFAKNPNTVRTVYAVIGVVIGFLAWIAAPIYGIIGVVSLIVCGLMVIVFGFFMPARTKKGVLAREHILGLKTYLTVAEKDRINFHNAPEKKPELFDKLLPYAMALGVEKEWAKQFADIYDHEPAWYSDASGAHFSALLLADSLNSFQAKANTTLSSRPSSASSGGSGFSGGGVGGGGGGGGGGSW